MDDVEVCRRFMQIRFLSGSERVITEDCITRIHEESGKSEEEIAQILNRNGMLGPHSDLYFELREEMQPHSVSMLDSKRASSSGFSKLVLILAGVAILTAILLML